jgi:hypothetical protein
MQDEEERKEMVLNPGCSNGIRMKASLKVARIFGILNQARSRQQE